MAVIDDAGLLVDCEASKSASSVLAAGIFRQHRSRGYRKDHPTAPERGSKAARLTIMTRDQFGPISPGDIYEDCAFHPVLCTNSHEDQISGISLIDATAPRACSLTHCGIIKLTIADVLEARDDFPAYQARRRQEIAAETSATGQTP